MAGEDDALLAEQVRFYRADAADYAEWLTSLADEANDSPQAIAFRAGRSRAAELLEARAPLGRVLEIAAGNGILSELIAPHATELALLDTSRESLRLARRRLSTSVVPVHDICADVFEWNPGGTRFDTICFASWLHHVPLTRFAAFWEVIDAALAPGGEVVFDFADRTLTHPADAHTPPAEPTEDYAIYRSDGVSIRDHHRRRWRVVDALWEPGHLTRRLAELGWDAAILTAGWFEGFHWASARRRP